MNSLIENILAMENEANQVLERARAEATALEKKTSAEIAAIQQEATTKVGEQIAAFRETAERRHAEAVADTQSIAQQALQALDAIPGETLSRQVMQILNAFREI